MARTAKITRKTGETDITLSLALDGAGRFAGGSGVGFLDHLLSALARHGMMDISLSCKGDLETGSHHTIEDVGIVLGIALRQALGDCRGIVRFGSATLPMDEALCAVSLDVSGRPYFLWRCDLGRGQSIGNFEADMGGEFFRAVAMQAGLTLHMNCIYGENAHHILECMMKAFARALDAAVRLDPRVTGVPSTKGVL